MQVISIPKQTSVLMVSNTGYRHNKGIPACTGQFVHPCCVYRLLCSPECCPNTSEEWPEPMRSLVTKIQQQMLSACIHFWSLYQLQRRVLYFCVPSRVLGHVHSLPRLLILFFCTPSFVSEISSLALIIVGSGRMNDLSYLIQ